MLMNAVDLLALMFKAAFINQPLSVCVVCLQSYTPFIFLKHTINVLDESVLNHLAATPLSSREIKSTIITKLCDNAMLGFANIKLVSSRL